MSSQRYPCVATYWYPWVSMVTHGSSGHAWAPALADGLMFLLGGVTFTFIHGHRIRHCEDNSV
jgi:hypothetical protein